MLLIIEYCWYCKQYSKRIHSIKPWSNVYHFVWFECWGCLSHDGNVVPIEDCQTPELAALFVNDHHHNPAHLQ